MTREEQKLIKKREAVIHELLGCMSVIARGEHPETAQQLAMICIEKVYNISGDDAEIKAE